MSRTGGCAQAGARPNAPIARRGGEAAIRDGRQAARLPIRPHQLQRLPVVLQQLLAELGDPYARHPAAHLTLRVAADELDVLGGLLLHLRVLESEAKVRGRPVLPPPVHTTVQIQFVEAEQALQVLFALALRTVVRDT